jgi:hypothetical protein
MVSALIPGGVRHYATLYVYCALHSFVHFLGLNGWSNTSPVELNQYTSAIPKYTSSLCSSRV